MFTQKKEASPLNKTKLAISLQNQKDTIQRQQEHRNEIGESLIRGCWKSSIFIINAPANLLVALGTMAYLGINSAIDDRNIENIDSKLSKLNTEAILNSTFP